MGLQDSPHIRWVSGPPDAPLLLPWEDGGVGINLDADTALREQFASMTVAQRLAAEALVRAALELSRELEASR